MGKRSSLIIEIGADSKAFKSELDRVKRQTKDLEDGLGKVAKISGAAFVGLTASVAGFVSQAAKFESINTQFQVLTGNTEKANRLMKELSDFSATTPFQFEDIAKAGQQLLGFGFSAESVRPKLQRIGDVASAVGVPINDLSLIFGQVSAAGKLTGERLLQLQERAVPIGPALAKTLGVAEDKIRDLVSTGQVDFATFEKAFNSLSEEGGLAFGGMAKQSETLSGLISTLKDNFSLLAADIGTVFVPFLKSAIEGLITFIKFVRENQQLIKFGGAVLGIATALTGLVTVLATASIAFLKLRALFIAVGGAAKIFSAAMNIVKFSIRGVIGATGIGLLIVAISLLVENWNTVRAVTVGTWAAITSVIRGAIGSLRPLLEGFGKLIAGVFALNPSLIADGITQTKNALAEGFSNAGITAAQAFNTAFNESLAEGSQGDTLEKLNENEKAKTAIIEQNAQERREIALARKELEDEEDKAEDELKKEELKESLRTDQMIRNELAREQRTRDLEEKKLRRTDEIKHGKEIAALKALYRSQELQKTEFFLTSLTGLMQSGNSTLFRIGQVAAIANATIKGIESAFLAYANLAPIPFIGPALGAAAAAAIGVVTATNVARIASQKPGKAQTGGIVPGSGRGDSQPFFLEPGEFITPRKNAEEFIGAVADQRARDALDEEGLNSGTLSNSPNNVTVEIVMSQNAAEIIEARLIERETLGISQRRRA